MAIIFKQKLAKHQISATNLVLITYKTPTASVSSYLEAF